MGKRERGGGCGGHLWCSIFGDVCGGEICIWQETRFELWTFSAFVFSYQCVKDRMLCQGATIAQPTAFCILPCPRQGWNSCYLSTFSVPRSFSPSFPCSLSLCLKAKRWRCPRKSFFSLVSTALVPVSRVGVSFQLYPPARVFGKEKRRKKEGEREGEGEREHLQARPSSSSTRRYARAKPKTAIIEYTLSLLTKVKVINKERFACRDMGGWIRVSWWPCMLTECTLEHTEPKHRDSRREWWQPPRLGSDQWWGSGDWGSRHWQHGSSSPVSCGHSTVCGRPWFSCWSCLYQACSCLFSSFREWETCAKGCWPRLNGNVLEVGLAGTVELIEERKRKKTNYKLTEWNEMRVGSKVVKKEKEWKRERGREGDGEEGEEGEDGGLMNEWKKRKKKKKRNSACPEKRGGESQIEIKWKRWASVPLLCSASIHSIFPSRLSPALKDNGWHHVCHSEHGTMIMDVIKRSRREVVLCMCVHPLVLSMSCLSDGTIQAGPTPKESQSTCHSDCVPDNPHFCRSVQIASPCPSDSWRIINKQTHRHLWRERQVHNALVNSTGLPTMRTCPFELLHEPSFHNVMDWFSCFSYLLSQNPVSTNQVVLSYSHDWQTQCRKA